MLRFLTAGETHGKCLVAILEGMPSNLKINISSINQMLSRRQSGYGRGGRMKIEKDSAEILSGVRGGVTLGSPISILIENKDYQNWEAVMSPKFGQSLDKGVTMPRPGHADLTGALKYNHSDIRNVLERASARETAARVAVGAIAKEFLALFGINVLGYVRSIGAAVDNTPYSKELEQSVQNSEVFMLSKAAENKAKEQIDIAKQKGESLGGVVEVVVTGVMPGLGSYVQYDRKLDAKIAFSLMSIQAIKGVEFGLGFETSKMMGSKVHDEIIYDKGYKRRTNNAGGIEGGMSNGEDIVVRAAMKPIPTLYCPLESININTKEKCLATVERSDTCAVPACSVVCEAAVAFEMAKALLEKFSGDCIEDILESCKSYKKRISK